MSAWIRPIFLIKYMQSTNKAILKDVILHLIINSNSNLNYFHSYVRDLGQEKCVESRVNRLQNLVENWSKLPEHVYFVSTLKGKVRKCCFPVEEKFTLCTLFCQHISKSGCIWSEILSRLIFLCDKKFAQINQLVTDCTFFSALCWTKSQIFYPVQWVYYFSFLGHARTSACN